MFSGTSNLMESHDQIRWPYISKSGLTGPLGKLIERVYELNVNPDFIPFGDVEDLIKLPEEVVCKLSTDQSTVTC